MKKIGFYFDLDGTLVDSAQDLFAAARFAVGDIAIDTIDKPSRELVSLGSRAMLSHMMGPSLTEMELDLVQEKFLQYYADNIAVHSRFYEGLDQSLLRLQKMNVPHAIVTNKAFSLSEKLMQWLLPQWQGVIIGDRMVENYTAKPAPDRLLKAIELTANQGGENFYFGDYFTDVQAAKRAGCHAIALRFGFHEENNPPENWGADAILESPDQLLSFIDAKLVA